MPDRDQNPDETPDETPVENPGEPSDSTDTKSTEATREPKTKEPAEEPAATGLPDARAARRRLAGAFLHPGRGQLVAAVLLFAVGLAGVMQVKSNQSDEGFSTARRTDLVQLLDGLNTESRRLEDEIADLERTRSTLQSGASSQRVARQEAQKRIDALGILAGTVPAQGPGIRVTINDPQDKLTAAELLDGIEELRDAGAEVIEINGKVRVVASSWFGSGPDGLVVDGTTLTRPVTIAAIGDQHSLQTGLTFRGGFADKVKANAGADLAFESVDQLRITSLHSPPGHQYAQPTATKSPR